mmetsp:Transcript_19772/g.25790  ORF Transcript_19772/g.25790 Transcript_19772/m.25790 type:complete len:410 (+) Transcript_19772:385-1614(+)
MPSPETCLSEWLTCSVTDDHALPCCDGLYCAIESDYYAQCQEIVNETSTPAHTSAYECGTSIADTSYVTSEYSNWVKSYILDTGVGLCVDQPDQGSKCVSEGLGYGMLLSAAFNDQETFDGLWQFVQYSFDGNGLPNWEMSPTGDVWGKGSATDADLDIALGLLMAANTFQSSSTDYTKAAITLINNIMEHEVDQTLLMLKPGDSWGNDSAYIAYNPSYFSPAHMHYFYLATNDKKWNDLIDQGYDFLLNDCTKYTLKNSGLVPDWTESLSSCQPGNTYQADMDNGADYYYDAIRTPWRLALHNSWTCDDNAQLWINNMASFFNSKGVDGLSQGFKMDGTSLGGDTSLCFVATSATSMLTATSSDINDNVRNAWYSATKTTTSGGGLYFCDALRMLSLTYQTGLMKPPL